MKIITPEVKYGFVYQPKNTFFVHSGWPSVCKDDRGVLYAGASSMRLSHVDPTGKNCLWLSFNEGQTWTPPMIVNDSYGDDRDVGLCYLGDGKLVMSYFIEAPAHFNQEITEYDFYGECAHELICGWIDAWKKLPNEIYSKLDDYYVKVSEDYGVTWSDPIRIPVTCPHGPSVCKDGTLVFMGKQYFDERAIKVYSSHDSGYTWEYTGTVEPSPDIVNDNMHEPHVVELPNGRLLGAIRVHAREGKTAPGELYAIYTTYSDDKGKTWSTPKEIPGVDGLPPHLMVHSSGAVICSYVCRTSGHRSERAVVSYDNGETWTEDYVLDHRVCGYPDMGYPCSVELKDGAILTVYYQPHPETANPCVQYAKWRLNNKALLND